MNFLQARLTWTGFLFPRAQKHQGSERGRLTGARVLPVVLCLLILVSLACGGGEEQLPEATVVPEVLQAQRFELMDAEGKVRMVMSVLEGGRPSLALLDAAGEARAWMFLSTDGHPRLVLTDTPLLVLADAQDEIRSVLRLEPDGAPVFGLIDESGATRSVIQLLSDGTPVFLLTDGDGEVIWSPLIDGQPLSANP